MDRVAELLRRRRIGIVVSEVDVLGLVAVRAPVALVPAAVGIVDDHPVIAVAVGDVHLVGGLVDEEFRREPQVLDVVAALALPALADLHEKSALTRELQHHAVVEVPLHARRLALVQPSTGLTAAAGLAAARARRLPPSVSPNPDVAFVVDGDPVVRLRPVIAGSRTAPVAGQIAVAVKLQHRRRRCAALGDPRCGGGVDLARLERSGAVNDPDVIGAVDRDADRLPENPVIRQRLRPQRIDFEPRRGDAVRRGGRRSPLDEPAAEGKSDQQ